MKDYLREKTRLIVTFSTDKEGHNVLASGSCEPFAHSILEPNLSSGAGLINRICSVTDIPMFCTFGGAIKSHNFILTAKMGIVRDERPA